VFQSFFDALPDLGDEARQHSGPLDAALARLANDPAVPAEFQMLARVERTRRSRSGGDQAGGVVPINAGGPRSKPGAGSVSRQVNDAATKAAAPSDVARVKLQLD
jgi:hypothetical protein